jgi:hypothetical protein
MAGAFTVHEDRARHFPRRLWPPFLPPCATGMTSAASIRLAEWSHLRAQPIDATRGAQRWAISKGAGTYRQLAGPGRHLPGQARHTFLASRRRHGPSCSPGARECV